SPDQEILVYLHLKAGEKLSGHAWSISKDMKDPGLPQLVKRWKPDPKYAPQSKSFPTGYALKLELGQMSEGLIPGKIFLALPDPEQSLVAGLFKAATSLVEGSVDAAAPAPPAPNAPSSAEKAAFDKRYGIKR